MVDVVILNQAEHASHTSNDTGLLAVVDMAAPYDVASYRFLCPAVVLSAADCVALHLGRAFYLLSCEIMVVFLVIVFSQRNSAAFAVTDIAVFDDPAF